MFISFLSFSAWAQDTARIDGTVTDATGAVVAGAKVTVSNPEKGFTRQLVSNNAGDYSISAVPIGNYVITAEAKGFEKLVRTGIVLTVGQVLRVNLQLQVGSTTQEVTVNANAAQVQTETATVSTQIGTTQIQNLDLNGRNWVSLSLLVPGAVPDNGLITSTVGVLANNSISFNGNRMEYSNWEIDGGSNTDEGSASTFNTYPSLDSIAEFRISTSNYGADMGQHAGANIQVVTKGGTQKFHGGAYDFVRNDVFDANDYFTNRSDIGFVPSRTPLKWNDFGYNIGGPLYIPGHYNVHKDKTFFFWSEEWRRQREGAVVGPTGTPSLLERQGNFSECDPNSGAYNSIVATGCLLPTYQGVTYDTVQSMPTFNAQSFADGQALLAAYVPSPNSGPVNYAATSSTPTNWRQEQIRVDQNVSDKTQVMARYTQDAWNTITIPSLWESGSYDTVKSTFDGPGKSAVLHVTHTFKPTLMNEFIASYTQDALAIYPFGAGESVGINRPSGFVMNHMFSQNDTNTEMPALYVGGGTQGFSEDEGNYVGPYNANPVITWRDNVSWIHNAHTVKMGFFLENYRKNEHFGTDTQGILNFYGGGSITTGNGLADMFLGNIQQYQEGTESVDGVAVGGYPKGHWQHIDLEPYIQDDWKVTKTLTLNLGVRYYIYTRNRDVAHPTIDSGFLPNEYNPADEAQLNAAGYLVPGTGDIWTNYGNGLVECGANGIPEGCQLRNTAGNIAPRFGFAWDPFGKGTSSLRGGYGIYYEYGNGNEAQSEGGEGNPPYDLSPSGFNLPGYTSIVNNGPLGPTGYTSWPYSQKWPSVQQFNLSAEHQFRTSDFISVAYVGALGRHLARAQMLNQINPATVANGKTMLAPELAGLAPSVTGLGVCPDPSLNAPGDVSCTYGANGQVTSKTGPAFCDASGNCNAATMMIFNEEPNIFFVPYRGYNTITEKEDTAVSSYNALQISYRHTTHGLTLQAAYTWSHAIDDSTETYQETSGGIDDYDMSRWKGTGDVNRTQVVQLNYVYALPFFKNASNGFTRQALHGWQITGITSFFTGEPTDFNCGVTGYSSDLGAGYRCDVTGKVQIDKHMYDDPVYGPTLSWWNPATVSQPQFSELSTTYGNMGRNMLTGPGRNNWDMALEKNFNLHGEGTGLQFRLETFNTFNHTQFQGMNTGCSGSTGFGQPCNLNTTSPGEVNSDWGPRNVQLSLKFMF